MDYLESQIRSSDLSPVFLGYSADTNRIARQFFHRYRLISHVFCKRVSFWKRFSPILNFHTIDRFTRDELLLTALENFADTVKNRDATLYLIPSTKDAAAFLSSYRERLETRFVIAQTDSIRAMMEIPPLQ